MSEHIFQKTIDEIAIYQKLHGIDQVGLAFHGGEPMLVGKALFDAYCRIARSGLGETAEIAIQTNGTLIDESWLELFGRYNVNVGFSIDGPMQLHDKHRVTHQGAGTYEKVAKNFALATNAARAGTIGWPSIISVLDPKTSAKQFYDWASREIHSKRISILVPDANHDNLDEYYDFKVDDLERYLIELFEIWWNSKDEISIRLFDSIIETLLGGQPSSETVGASGATTVVIDVDGEIQSHDVLRTCESDFATLLNVQSNRIEELFEDKFYKAVNIEASQACSTCQNCSVFDYCRGGFIFHRFSKLNRFDNPSVFCSAWFALITHIYLSIKGLEIDEFTKRDLAIQAVTHGD